MVEKGDTLHTLDMTVTNCSRDRGFYSRALSPECTFPFTCLDLKCFFNLDPLPYSFP